MKNSFKLGVAALAIAVSFAACKGNNSGNTGDTTKADTTKKVVVDSTKVVVDSTKKTDTTTKKDTTKK